jgi:putative tryptophan/tyrosine transport system substrate-binding protein
MKRRDFMTALAGTTAWVATARAQEPRRTIGVLGSAFYGAFPGAEAAFIQGLKGSGFIEGKNINIEWRWAEGQYDRLPSLASELVRRGVTVIVAQDAPSAFAAKAASSNTSIVFGIGTDPVKVGLVDRFNRPAGHITGVYNLVTGLASKHLELVHDLLPAARTIALFVNPRNPNAHVYVPETRAAADALGLHLEVLTASAEGDLEAAFKIIVQQRADALVMIADPFFIGWRKQFVALAAGSATPAIYPLRWFADVGGLMSYGADGSLASRVGTYVGRILQGVKPMDLPIEQSTKVELVINLKTAKALGLAVPPSLLASADEVIE